MAVGRSAAEKQVRRAEVCSAAASAVQWQLRTHPSRGGTPWGAKVGPAADTIAALATKGKYDLLMMGSHGHGLLGNLVLGSVTTKGMGKCRVPVLSVR